MRRHPGQLIQTVTPVNNLSRSVSLRQQNDSISGTGKSAADNNAGSGTFRQSNGASRPAGHDRTVDQTKSSRSGRCCRNSILCRYPCCSCRRDRTGTGAAVAEQGQDMLPAGMNEDGVIEDMQAYDAWLADEQTQRDMQRREEVNINHSHRHDEQDDVEIGGNF
jgi:hypothetical protein